MADPEGWVSISQSELAEFLGATRESVNKMLNDWRSRSLISIRRGGIGAQPRRAARNGSRRTLLKTLAEQDAGPAVPRPIAGRAAAHSGCFSHRQGKIKRM